MKEKKKMNKSTIAVASVFVMTIFTTNIFPNGRSIAQSKQINLSGNWNMKLTPEFNGFTFGDQGCTAGYNGEIRVGNGRTINRKQPSRKISGHLVGNG